MQNIQIEKRKKMKFMRLDKLFDQKTDQNLGWDNIFNNQNHNRMLNQN